MALLWRVDPAGVHTMMVVDEKHIILNTKQHLQTSPTVDPAGVTTTLVVIEKHIILNTKQHQYKLARYGTTMNSRSSWSHHYTGCGWETYPIKHLATPV